MAAKTATTNDRVVTIVLLIVGVVLTLIWAPFSLISVMISDNGMNALKYVGLYLLLLGPATAVLALGISAIVAMARKQRAWILGLLTAIAPIVMIVVGFLVAALGNSSM